MTDREHPIPPGHTPQQDPKWAVRPDATPDQDQGESSEFLEQLAGTHSDATAYIDDEDIGRLEGITTTDIYQGETDVNQVRVEGDDESLDFLEARELREGETDDVMVAVQEGYTYVPPIDPPVEPSPDAFENVEVAAGTTTSASDPKHPESGLDTAHMGEDDMTALVRRSLRDDSLTAHLADRLVIATVNGTVIVRGNVDDLDDSDNIVAVVSDIPGVQAVRDETVVGGL